MGATASHDVSAANSPKHLLTSSPVLRGDVRLASGLPPCDEAGLPTASTTRLCARSADAASASPMPLHRRLMLRGNGRGHGSVSGDGHQSRVFTKQGGGAGRSGSSSSSSSSSSIGATTALFIHSTGVKEYRDRYTKAGGKATFYFRELHNLCASIALHSPGVPLSIITDAAAALRKGLASANGCPSLDRIVTNTIPLKPNTSWAEKPVALMQSPYEHTVFLDVDTTVCASLRPAFAFLDQYDFAMAPEALDLKDMHMLRRPLEQHPQQAQAQARGARGGGKDGGARAREIALPCYFEMNSGVIYYRRSAAVRDFFRELQRRQTSGDQHFFHLFGTAKGLLGKTSALRTLQLPPEYNLRMRGGDAPRLLTGPVRVLHGKSQAFPHVTCASLNRDVGFRLWSSSGGLVPVDVPAGAGGAAAPIG